MGTKIYVTTTATIVVAIFIASSYANFHEYALAAISTSSSDFIFGAAGDWSHTPNAKDTANNMASHHVKLALGLGDYDYRRGSAAISSWWNNPMAPLHGITFRGALGNHDVLDSAFYARDFREDDNNYRYFSFDKENVHFLALDPNNAYGVGSEQYNFVKDDLSRAASNSTIKWIVVFFHQPMYTSPTTHGALASLRDTYHPLFDKYHVDLVLQGHNHDYQRTYPLMYDANSPSNPIITDMNRNIYKHPSGEVYAVVGTGGEETYPFGGLSSYVATQFTGIHGYLNIDIINNGQTLDGTFYSDSGAIMDSFTIDKA